MVKNVGSIALGLNKASDGIVFDENRRCEVVVVDINKMEIAKTFKLDPIAVVHFGSSHLKTGKLFVDACKTDNFETNQQLSNLFNPDFDFSIGGTRYCQYEINLAIDVISYRGINEDASPCEFPQWSWHRTAVETRYAYVAAFFDNGAKNYFQWHSKI